MSGDKMSLNFNSNSNKNNNLALNPPPGFDYHSLLTNAASSLFNNNNNNSLLFNWSSFADTLYSSLSSSSSTSSADVNSYCSQFIIRNGREQQLQREMKNSISSDSFLLNSNNNNNIAETSISTASTTAPNQNQSTTTKPSFNSRKANYIATIQNGQNQELEKFNYKLFIKGIPYHYNKCDLNNLIQLYATPINIELPLKSDDKRVNLGYGFASFKSKQDADLVLSRLNKARIGRLCLNVEYFIAK